MSEKTNLQFWNGFNARGKVGKQKIGKNLEFMNAIKDKWLSEDLRPDAIRGMLKRTFFSYFIPRQNHQMIQSAITV